MSKPEPIAEDRALTEQEYRLTRWMLEHGWPEAVGFIEQLELARIVSRCPCGCASIDFAIQNLSGTGGNMQILADFLFGDEEHLCGAFVFAQNGILSGLEVYGLAVDAPKDLPEPQQLRPLCDES